MAAYDWTTVLWLLPPALGLLLAAAAAWWRDTALAGMAAIVVLLWAAAWFTNGVRCINEGFEGPATTLDGKLPWECRPTP